MTSPRQLLHDLDLAVLVPAQRRRHQEEEEEEGQEEEEGHVGGDSDTHGCKASAGYTWCEPKKKCVRLWEEPCPGLGWGLGEEGGGDDEGGNWADGI